LYLYELDGELFYYTTNNLFVSLDNCLRKSFNSAVNLLHSIRRDLQWSTILPKYAKIVTSIKVQDEINRLQGPKVAESFRGMLSMTRKTKPIEETDVSVTVLSEIFNKLDVYFDLLAPKPIENVSNSNGKPKFTSPEEIRKHHKKIAEIQALKTRAFGAVGNSPIRPGNTYRTYRRPA